MNHCNIPIQLLLSGHGMSTNGNYIIITHAIGKACVIEAKADVASDPPRA
jgi:hypothetical protein